MSMIKRINFSNLRKYNCNYFEKPLFIILISILCRKKQLELKLHLNLLY